MQSTSGARCRLVSNPAEGSLRRWPPPPPLPRGRTEGGLSQNFSLALTSDPDVSHGADEPAYRVTVIISGSNRQIVVSPESLIFTKSNWGVPQHVTVSAVDDQIDEIRLETNKLEANQGANGAPRCRSHKQSLSACMWRKVSRD